MIRRYRPLVLAILGFSLAGCQSLGNRANDEKTAAALNSLDAVVPATASRRHNLLLPQELDTETAKNVLRARQKLDHVSLEKSGASHAADLWERLRPLYDLPLEHEDPRLQAEIDWYVRHPAAIERAIDRSRRYMFHIVKEIDRRDLPGELAMLPIVESAFDPFAYSSSHASGLWQFIPSTGRMYGLEQNWWYDGRRDVVAATDAALRYLENLAESFDGDWLLALASYNAGPGTVSRAIKKNQARGKPTDFWSLDLPDETRAYVPKLLAIATIMAAPEQYGINPAKLPNEPYFEVVDTNFQVDLTQAAKLANIDVEEMYLLNPAFNRRTTAPDGPHSLLVPTESADLFENALASLEDGDRITWQHYRVKSGDSLASIARHFGTSTDAINQANQLSSGRIRRSQQLLIPVGGDAEILPASADSSQGKLQVALQKAEGDSPSKSTGNRFEHKIRRGDTLWSIAKSNQVGVTALARWNGISTRESLTAGQTLVIWRDGQPGKLLATADTDSDGTPIKASAKRVGYKVKAGDSLFQIADRFKVSVSEITAWNQISSRQHLKPGQKLVLYVASSAR